MPAPLKKASLDEIMTKRQGNVMKTGRGDAIFKVASKAPRSYDAETRSARFIMTSESKDRYGDIVRQAGMQIDRFLENPQALMFHNSRNWPIGSWENVLKVLTGRPKRTEGDLKFMEEGLDEDSDRANVHVAAGTIRAVSIGFMPLDWEALTDDEGRWTGYDFTESELYECSLVPIPAQPDALVKAAGADYKLLASILEEVLDNYEKTPEGLILPKAEYNKAYQTVRTKLAPAPALPVTDKEQAEAALRAAEFEVGKVCPPTEGGVAAVEGEIKGKFVVQDGKWKHAGDVAANDKVNYVVETKVADDKTVYTLTHKFAATLVRGEKGWAPPAADETTEPSAVDKFISSLKKGDAVTLAKQWKMDGGEPVEDGAVACVKRDDKEFLVHLAGFAEEVDTLRINEAVTKINAEPSPTKIGEVVVEFDAEAIEAEVQTLTTTLLDSFRERIGKMFKTKTIEQERIEPTLDTPAPPPSAEQIAVARARAAAARQRALEVLA